MSDQRDILESNNSRRIFDQVKDDSSSLCCLRDSVSFWNRLTATTETSSKLSREFDFDAEIMTSKVYKGQMRSLVRRAMRKSSQAKSKDPAEQGEERQSLLLNSATVEKSLKRERKAQRSQEQILLLGQDDNEKCLFLHEMRLQLGKTYSLQERQIAKQMIHHFLCSVIPKCIEVIKASGVVSLEGDPLDSWLPKGSTVQDAIVSQDVAKSLYDLWSDSTLKEIIQKNTDKKYLGPIT